MNQNNKKIKYPRTPHLPWTKGMNLDDVIIKDVSQFEGKKVVVTEKMDGENTTLYSFGSHARSLDSGFHPSRTWVRALQGQIGYLIPKGWRICGENVYAKHSLYYQNLASYFLVFSVWNVRNECLSWADTKAFAANLGLVCVPELYIGLWCAKSIQKLPLDLTKQEGYVVRLAESFAFEAFENSVAKWVRKGHVQTSEHWMKQQLVANVLCKKGSQA